MSDENEIYKNFKQLSRSPENESNYDKAMRILKTGNLMFMAGIKNELDEKVLANNLQETTNKYREIVDSKDKLDNFAREFLEFQKTLPEKFSIQNIESGLTDPAKYIKLADCKGQFETCKKSELTKSELEELFDSPEFKPKFRDPDEFLEDQSDYKAFPTTQHLFQPNASISMSTKSSNASSNNPKLAALSEALFRKPKSSSSGEPKKITSENPTASTSSFNTNKPYTVTSNSQNNTEKEESEQVKKYPDFMNSKDVLKIQNYKKYGDPNYISVSSSSSNNTKRTLGGKRYGVNKPFVAPFASDNNNGKNEKSVNMETEEVVNEHLKNIDPKMVELIKNEIMDTFTPVTWDDIAGLNYAKGIINEAVILPILRPDLFKGLRNPPKGILLFGPPGTGKTLIGKCIASQSKSTFFNISASSLTSKWIGEGEKMVRALFAVARAHQPAVVFIDEIDSLLCQRSETEHESSRRLKTEFLVQFDGANTGDDDRILIVAATNRPQELDEAARRRFTKKLYIPLPELPARVQIIKNLLQKESHQLSLSDIQEIGKLTDGFSGADMKILCQEASMFPIRQIAFSQISSITPSDVRPINFKDFKDALEGVRASVSQEDLGQYEQWDRTFGSGKK